jgi:hypothetical protein
VLVQQPDPVTEARFVGHDDARDASRLAGPRAATG